MNIHEYEKDGRALYAEFAAVVVAILHAAIDERDDLHLQSIPFRAKTVPSLRVKLKRAAAQENDQIGDIAKDIAGCRIIFYTNGDVYRFGQSGILHANFDIDHERSKMHYPKDDETDADFFISENWVVQLKESRCELPEYRRFSGLRCEIQVQTILDHAWAEMAHDTIYKPMTDANFGTRAVEAMRKRLRKVMRDYLQPAGYEFEKIASDYACLREGKSLFDEDALAVIHRCQDRNRLFDAISRFSDYVLPNYNDFSAWAPEIIATLSDAAVRSITMPNIPQTTGLSEFPGVSVEYLLDRIVRVLQSGFLLYADPNRMFDAIIAIRRATSADAQRKPVDSLASRFARYDTHAWSQVGPAIQRMVVDRVASRDDVLLIDAAPVVTLMLREALSSTISGTTLSADAMTLHAGAVPMSDALVAIRRDALAQLERLHALLPEGGTRADVRHAMVTVGDLPDTGTYSDRLVLVVMGDLVRVVHFFIKIVPTLPLEAKRQLEVELFRIYYHYHTLPPVRAGAKELAAAHARLLETISAWRAEIDKDKDLCKYRLLVGYDSVSQIMWDKISYDFEGSCAERSKAIAALVATVSDTTSAQWLADIERYVQTHSSDLAMFMGLDEFVRKLAEQCPGILLSWLPRLSDRLAQWLPGMLHALAKAGQAEVTEPTIEGFVTQGRHLSAIAWYLQRAERFSFDLLLSIAEQALRPEDDPTLVNVTFAAAHQSAKCPGDLFGRIYLPAVRALEGRGNHLWLGNMFNWQSPDLLESLTAAQAEQLLPLFVDVPRLGRGGEEMLAVIARNHPAAVLDLIGRRFNHERSSTEPDYEALPYNLFSLKSPLAAAPDKVVAATRNWFDSAPDYARFRGGRLISELFPNLEDPLPTLLRSQIVSDRNGVEFVLSLLRAYEGQAFLHPLLRDIVAQLTPGDDLLNAVSLVIDEAGLLEGDYGSAKAQEERRTLVETWKSDDRPAVRNFATTYLKSADTQLAWERRHADERAAMHKIAWKE